VWREGFVNGGDTRFFVRVQGHGDDVALLLHGWPEDGTAWRAVAPLLADAGMRVVCPDLKGFGASDAPGGGYDPETLADEISQLIRNLHVRRVVLVGHDWGGAVAIATAFRHPGRVRGLVVVSAPYRQIDLRRAWHIPLFNIPVVPELLFSSRPVTRRLVAGALHYAGARPEPFPDDVVDEYTTAVSTSPRGWLAYYRSLSRRAVAEWATRRLRKRVGGAAAERAPLRVPATVLWGSQDRVTPLHLGRRVAYDLEASFVAVPDVGHFVPEEAPRATAAAILGMAEQTAAAGQSQSQGA
jgi:pimeloyl-ACP methyl ester carboxylesterase